MSKKRMPLNVLHVTFNMGVGGTEQVISQLIEGSNPEKLRHQIVCIDGTVGDMGKQLSARGVNVWAMQRRAGVDLRLALKLRRLIREQHINIVHCHQYTPYFYGWLASLLTPASVVFTEHGRFHPDRYRTKAKWVNRMMAKSTAGLTAISRSTAEALAKYEFLPGHRIQVIYNGIKGKRLSAESRSTLVRNLDLPSGASVLCMVSRLDPIKNHELALRALCKLKDRGINVVMLIVGDGPERQRIENLVGELGLERQVRIVGYSSTPECYVSISDIYLLTSFSEGTSMTLLEAMSLGVAVVATEVGGNPEIITDGQTGCLVPSDDLDALVDVLQGLLSQPEKLSQLGLAAKEAFRERFSVATMVGHYMDLYQHVAGERL